MKVTEEEKRLKLAADASYGAQCRMVLNSAPFQNAFLEMKSELLKKFESIGSNQIEDLQEAHRTYKNLSVLERYFEKHISRGDAATNRLN